MAAGYKIEPCFGSEKTTVVVEFPIKLEDGIRTQDEVSVWEKTQLAAFIQKYWADNQVSVTIDFDPNSEKKDIKPILEYFQYHLKSISFLPRSAGAFKQMPYEVITEEQYNIAIKTLTKLSFASMDRSKEDEKEIDVFCDGDTCTIETSSTK
jgi:hypothetical protein